MTAPTPINPHLEQNAFVNNRLLSSFQILLNQMDEGSDTTQTLSHCQQLWAESSFHLSSLSIKNFRALKNIKLNFNDSLTVIFGVNGAGKTAILDAIAKSLSVLAGSIKSSNVGGALLDEKDINADIDRDEICEIETTLTLKKHDSLNCCLSRAPIGSIRSVRSDLSDFKSLGKALRYLNNYQEESLPIMAFYSVRRSENMKPSYGSPMKKNPNKQNRIANLYPSTSLNGDLSLANFGEWFIRLNRRTDSQSLKDQENFKALIVKTVPFVEDLRVRVDANGDEIIEVKIGETFRDYSLLSDGQRVYLGLLLDLGQRLILANPLSKTPFEGRGIVLIDEIDLHLHPQWQREVLPLLREAFPNIQFIVTTHSPQVISSVEKKHLQLLNVDVNHDIQVGPVNYQTDGATSSEVLANLMDVPLRREDSAITKSLNDFLRHSLDPNYSDKALDQSYNKLEATLNCDMLKEVHRAKFARDAKKRLAMRIKKNEIFRP